MPGESVQPARDLPAKRVVVGTAGHIDHGKTALVYALTGTDTDRLPEEKKRGITIDLGFAAMDLRASDGTRFELSLIDVPGHHAFIRNMLAGAGGIDLVLLVIAADEGVKPQTEEHLAICQLLGVKSGVVALTKADKIDPEKIQGICESVRHFLAGTFLAQAPIVPVSAIAKAGIEDLKRALATAAASPYPPNSNAVMRLPIDRSFSIKGFGTVVTGTLSAGAIRPGDLLELHPAARSLRVRGVQVHGRDRQLVEGPCRVAVNLAGVEVADVQRGHTLASPGLSSPTLHADVALTFLKAARIPKHNSKVRVHAFASETLGKILYLDAARGDVTSPVIARLQFADPLLLAPGDRLVLRQCSPAQTIGGALVLDRVLVPGQKKREARAWLFRLMEANDRERWRLRLQRRGSLGLSLADAVTEVGVCEESVQAQMASLVAEKQVVQCAEAHHWIAAEVLASLVQAADRELTASGRSSQAELRRRLKCESPIFELLLEHLARTGKFAADNEAIAVKGNGISAAMEKQLRAIEDVYAGAGLAAPLLSDVKRQLGLTDRAAREAITLLLRSKRLVRMRADDAFVHPEALKHLYERLRAHRGEVFDVGRFKTFTGLTRKHAIPLLEHLDEVRVTRNNAGSRVVL